MAAILLFLPVIGRSLRVALENGYTIVTVTLFWLAFASVIYLIFFDTTFVHVLSALFSDLHGCLYGGVGEKEASIGQAH